MKKKSELDKWERNSKIATGAIPTAIIGGVALIGKALINHIAKSSEDASYKGVKKAETEATLNKEQKRKGVGKSMHKKDREAAQKEYDKYH